MKTLSRWLAMQILMRRKNHRFGKETNMHYNYYRGRYQPDLGHYSLSDSTCLNSGINTYAYASGNPISFIAPRGLKLAIDSNLAPAINDMRKRPKTFDGLLKKMDNSSYNFQVRERENNGESGVIAYHFYLRVCR